MADDNQDRARALVTQAKAQRGAGDKPAALSSYTEAAQLLQSEDSARFAHTIRHAAEIAWELGRLDAAEQYIAQALAVYQKDAPGDLEFANTLRVDALIRETLGEKKKAMALWGEARVLYEAAGVDEGAEACRLRIAALF